MQWYCENNDDDDGNSHGEIDDWDDDDDDYLDSWDGMSELESDLINNIDHDDFNIVGSWWHLSRLQ